MGELDGGHGKVTVDDWYFSLSPISFLFRSGGRWAFWQMGDFIFSHNRSRAGVRFERGRLFQSIGCKGIPIPRWRQLIRFFFPPFLPFSPFPSPWDRDWIGLSVMMVLLCGVMLVMIVHVPLAGRVQLRQAAAGIFRRRRAAAVIPKKVGVAALRHG